jgi:hypothetical protein
MKCSTKYACSYHTGTNFSSAIVPLRVRLIAMIGKPCTEGLRSVLGVIKICSNLS